MSLPSWALVPPQAPSLGPRLYSVTYQRSQLLTPALGGVHSHTVHDKPTRGHLDFYTEDLWPLDMSGSSTNGSPMVLSSGMDCDPRQFMKRDSDLCGTAYIHWPE